MTLRDEAGMISTTFKEIFLCPGKKMFRKCVNLETWGGEVRWLFIPFVFHSDYDFYYIRRKTITT